MLEAVAVLIGFLVMVLLAWDACNGFVLRWDIVAIVCGVVLGLAVIASPARAQHVHPDETITDERVAKFYDTWKIAPERYASCCSRKDCYAAPIRRNPSGGLEYFHKWTGTWAALPSKVLEHNQADPRESPNSESHVCANETYPETVYCAVLGSGT